MLQIALMGITRALVGFVFSFWYAIEDVVNAFLDFLFSFPVIGSIVEIFADILW